MSVMQLHGVPFIFDQPTVPSSLERSLGAEKAELEAIGVTVTGIRKVGAEIPFRFDIKFPPGLSYRLRHELERKRWTIGQTLGKELSFYAYRGTKQSSGFED